MRALAVVLVLAWSVAACVGPPAVERSAQEIIQGSAAMDAPWAVMVVQQAAGSTRVRLCTGTVIAPRAVLTAKHCVFLDDGDGTWAEVPPGDLTVRTGEDFRAVIRTVAVSAVRTTDGPYRDGDGRNGGDIAVVITAEDLAITPREISRAPASVNDSLRIVGYGYSRPGGPSTDLGVKREGAARVARVEPDVFSTTGAQWTCTGDSGGPALDGAGRVVGVTSIGPAGCTVSTSYYTRVDRYLSLLEDLLPAPPADAGASLADGGASLRDTGASTLDAGSAHADVASAGAATGGCSAGRGAGSPMAMALLAGLLRRRRRAGRSDTVRGT